MQTVRTFQESLIGAVGNVGERVARATEKGKSISFNFQTAGTSKNKILPIDIRTIPGRDFRYGFAALGWQMEIWRHEYVARDDRL